MPSLLDAIGSETGRSGGFLTTLTMRSFFVRVAVVAIALVSPAFASAPTDSYTDADLAQSGYLPNHNMDPAVVDSAQFGLLWKVAFNALEQVRLRFHIEAWARSRVVWGAYGQDVPCHGRSPRDYQHMSSGISADHWLGGNSSMRSHWYTHRSQALLNSSSWRPRRIGYVLSMQRLAQSSMLAKCIFLSSKAKSVARTYQIPSGSSALRSLIPLRILPTSSPKPIFLIFVLRETRASTTVSIISMVLTSIPLPMPFPLS